VLIALGAYIALQWTVTRYEALDGDPSLAERAGIAALLGGFLGARIGYVLPRLDSYLDRPGDILAIWQGGLTLFGGLTGGTLAVVLVLRLARARVGPFADAIAPALPLAQAIGRWGNYFNQELYGRPTDAPWALEVDLYARRADVADATTFHPTFLYESLWNAALVIVLVRLDRRRLVPRGALIFVYLLGYGIGRAWIELLRIDTLERYAGLSRNNWIAILITIVGLAGLQRARRRAADSLEAKDPTTGDAAPGPATATIDFDDEGEAREAPETPEA
jgi:prolipoprotein diacylglyceryl transferase